ncbi:MAG: transposase [Bacteroidales bacterium]|nr:transposase [Bacteroidales bacterium]
MDKYPIAASSLEKYYHINGDQFERQYKEHLSGFTEWEDAPHASEWLVYPENFGPKMSIDETSLSDGELYTIVSNKDAHGQKGAMAAIIHGTKAEVVNTALNQVPLDKRQLVTEITLDLSPSMRNICIMRFPNAKRVIDRFHIQKLACDAIQEMRIAHRWEALKAEHKRKLWVRETGEVIPPEKFENGDTRPQLLVRSRYLLFKSYEKWTESQKLRAKILFEQYPDLKKAYDLTDELRRIFSNTPRRSLGATRLAKWYASVENSGFDSFKVIAATFFDHETEILNFFDNRSTNASAESFNCKIKNFRAQLRGVSDINYFLFRLQNIYA